MAKTASVKPAAKAPKSKATANPLLAKWRTPFKMPPFAEIEPAHYAPAFKAAFAEHRREIADIASATSKPTFANTIVALERAGEALSRVAEVFYNLASADTSDALQAIERDLAPQFADHYSKINLNAKLFARIADLHERREKLNLDDEQARILERTYLSFAPAPSSRPRTRSASPKSTAAWPS